MEEEDILQIVRSNPLCKGVTFSGGEPFAQAEGFGILAGLLKESGYEVASYSGYTFEQLLEGTTAQKQLLEKIDILIDGPFLLAERSLDLSFRGSRNQASQRRRSPSPQPRKAHTCKTSQNRRFKKVRAGTKKQ